MLAVLSLAPLSLILERDQPVLLLLLLKDDEVADFG